MGDLKRTKAYTYFKPKYIFYATSSTSPIHITDSRVHPLHSESVARLRAKIRAH